MTQEVEYLQLQVNTAGAWRTVIRFHADPLDAFGHVSVAVLYLHRADPAASWRIATCDSVPRALHRLDARTCGNWCAVK